MINLTGRSLQIWATSIALASIVGVVACGSDGGITQPGQRRAGARGEIAPDSTTVFGVTLAPLTTDFSEWCTDAYGHLHEFAYECAQAGEPTPTIPDPPSYDPGGTGGGGGDPTPAPDPPTPPGEPPADSTAPSTWCPTMLGGKLITALIPVGGAGVQEFRFDGANLKGGGWSPARYTLTHPTANRDGSWFAESGWITINCVGYFTPSVGGFRLWIGNASWAGGSDLHMVQGPLP